MARSTYSGGTVTRYITVEHTWGSDDTRVVANVVGPDGLPLARLAMPADVMREVGQALIGAADEFNPEVDDDVTEPDYEAPRRPATGKVQPGDVDHLGTTLAERRVLAALSGTEARTPAELKRRMPGATPVATIRSLLGNLQSKGLARPAADLATLEAGNATPWVSVGAGVAHSEAERQASLEATR